MIKAHIVHSSSRFPSRYYDQQTLADTIVGFLEKHKLEFAHDTVRSLFRNVEIDGRYFEFPVERFNDPQSVSATAAQAVEACVNHAEFNARAVLEQAGLAPAEIDQIVSVTLTPAVPGVEARLMNRIAFRHDVVRLPLAGLGCMAGVAGINRAADYLHGHPTHATLLISCELSSALWQGSIQGDLHGLLRKLEHDPALHGEVVMAIVTAALFGDGSAALLMVGRDHPLAGKGAVSILDTQSNWVPDTEHIMGLDYMDCGMRNILRPEVKTYVAGGLANVIEPMLKRRMMRGSDIAHWILHPGGPKIMDAAEAAFGLTADMMRPSRETLKAVGNVSSATVLYMLDNILRGGDRPVVGTPGLIVAMGPGFSQEAALVEWQA